MSLWTGFRERSVVVQAVVWLVAWPVLLALLLASTATRARQVAGAAVLLIAGPLWVTMFTSGDDEPASVEIEEFAADVQERDPEPDGEEAEEPEEPEEPDDEGEDAEDAEAEEDAEDEEERDRDDDRDPDDDDRAPGDDDRASDAKAEPRATAPATRSWTVTNVVDGDTVDVRAADGTEERVRVIGIDTPERGECGFNRATDAMAALVLDEQVALVDGARDDRDHYDRILRYLDVAGTDAGLTLIEDGLAISRYDSRDGYGKHTREHRYIAADNGLQVACDDPEPAPQPAPAPERTSGPGSGPGGSWKNCTEARDHDADPVHRGDPGYGNHLDRDQDGVGCE